MLTRVMRAKAGARLEAALAQKQQQQQQLQQAPCQQLQVVLQEQLQCQMVWVMDLKKTTTCRMLRSITTTSSSRSASGPQHPSKCLPAALEQQLQQGEVQRPVPRAA
jgi:hypothetical protein